jgi:hypothetical protein
LSSSAAPSLALSVAPSGCIWTQTVSEDGRRRGDDVRLKTAQARDVDCRKKAVFFVSASVGDAESLRLWSASDRNKTIVKIFLHVSHWCFQPQPTMKKYVNFSTVHRKIADHIWISSYSIHPASHTNIVAQHYGQKLQKEDTTELRAEAQADTRWEQVQTYDNLGRQSKGQFEKLQERILQK